MQVNPFGRIDEEVSKKVSGSNARGNASVDFENYNGVGTVEIKATTPSTNTPSINFNINPQTRLLNVFADTGSGYEFVGSISIS